MSCGTFLATRTEPAERSSRTSQLLSRIPILHIDNTYTTDTRHPDSYGNLRKGQIKNNADSAHPVAVLRDQHVLCSARARVHLLVHSNVCNPVLVCVSCASKVVPTCPMERERDMRLGLSGMESSCLQVCRFAC